MPSTSVTPVILGLLALGPRSGYEIKTTVDRSTRFFWAASYGQIYPELKRLESEGLVVGEDSPNGRRARRVYRLTDAGGAELERWLLGRDTTVELRDENLLRLFFADALPRAEAARPLRGRGAAHAGADPAGGGAALAGGAAAPPARVGSPRGRGPAVRRPGAAVGT